jgi:diadenosine tetraphosphate (Ap4A) HIT family hydrolase
MMTTLIHQRIQEARMGKNPTVICRVRSGWVVLGDVQFLPGYCLLLSDPIAPDLNALSAEQRKTFLYEMSVIGDALMVILDAYLINYEILGNSEHALHAHIFPRYMRELDQNRKKPVWFYDRQDAPQFDPVKHKNLMDQIHAYLKAQRLTLPEPDKNQLRLFTL